MIPTPERADTSRQLKRGDALASLQPPDEQPVAPRLARLGSLRREVETLLAVAPDDATPEVFRWLVLQANVLGKATASTRRWTWASIKLRYILDPAVAEYRAFRSGMRASQSPHDRGLICLLMFARADRLFRELMLECVSPYLARDGEPIDGTAVRTAIEERGRQAGLKWAQSTMQAMAIRFLSAAKDFGVIRGSRARRTVRPRPGDQVSLFAARLARLEGLTERQALEGRWFRLLGLGREDAADLLQAAARDGVLAFRMQADVVELRLPRTEDR